MCNHIEKTGTGIQHWCRDGNLYHKNGPATIDANGKQSWCRGDNLYREDYPSDATTGEATRWFANGREVDASLVSFGEDTQ